MADLAQATRKSGAALLLGAALALWLLNHPYQGIWHDARIYGLIAAHWLHPQALADDLFFRYGSQASLSLFTPIYGALVGAMGLDWAARLVVLSGAAFWAAALFALSRAMLGDTLAGRFAVLLAVVLDVSYSPNASIFLFNENFATARSWALPAGLASVALLAGGRRSAAAGLALLALLLHPLLGIWPLALVVAQRLPLRVVGAVALAPTLALLLVGSVGGCDVAGLRLIDGTWLEQVREASDIVFKPDSTRLSFDMLALGALLLGLRAGSPRLRPFYANVLVVGAGALLLALGASYVFPLEIVVQGQPWRVMWLVIPLAGMALLDALQVLQARSPARFAVPWLCAVLLALVSLGMLSGVWVVAGALTATLLPPRILAAAAQRLEAWRKPALAALAALWLAALPGLWLELDIAGNRFLGTWWDGPAPLHGLLAGATWPLPLVLAAALGPVAKRRAVAAVAALLLGVALMALLVHWDWRSDARRGEEASWLDPRQPPHPFARFVRPGQTVAWPERETTVWLALHTPSYVGKLQRTGMVFSHRKFTEWQRRDALAAKAASRLALCADPVLDWVVTPQPVAASAPVAVSSGAALYACAGRRGALPAS